ncbi:ABC transporter substrate-binding protein [Paenibacillus alginolyticus]|uniref:ABC transporter substrate-binding protein n=1 Tax=Paenibacillus alginolyticus TaxID=59839 RepID=A0ABT4GAE8_9BACL|nr:ABC transporter substrate-binding protein [Paenibacillus alginolyticus]MCY9693165.1 ABC transporter substrate-binding protein [Paenibacillus alginolyticus]MEC0144540.1 ABC transporter substrate-binding protein [Paenibacillus alginolyticus]
MALKSTSWKLALSSSILLCALLTACSSGGEAQPSGGGSGNDKPSVQLTFAYLNPGGTMTDLGLVQDEINKITKQKINATVKLLPIDGAAWTQQVNLLLAGNEPLDLLMTSSFFNYSSQVAKGQLRPLDDLLNKYGQGIKSSLEPIFYDGTKINGKIYGVASFRELVADYGFIARKDLQDKYNIDLSKIKSFEDLEMVFKTIKDNEPGMSPLVQRSSTTTVVGDMMGSKADGLGDSLGVLMLDDKNTKVVNLYETPQYKDAVALARKWYQAGYIMKDAATTQESGFALVKAGKGFGYFSNMKPGFEIQEKGLTGFEMKAVRLSKPIGGATGPIAFMVSIPSNTKYPDEAMKLMNLLYTDADVMNLLDNGIEGKHYVKVKDGIIKKPDGAASGYTFNQWEIGNNSLTALWEGNDSDHWNHLKQFNMSAVYSPAVGFSFDAANVKTEVASVTNVINQYKAGLESGSLDPKALPEFIDKLKTAGMDKIVAEKQKQLDAWLASNGKK